MEYRYMRLMKFIKNSNRSIGSIKALSIRSIVFLLVKMKIESFSKNTGGTLVEKCIFWFNALIIKSEPFSVYASGNQDVNHINERYNNRKPDIIDNAYVVVNFKNGVRGLLDLCMFAENSDMQEELLAVVTWKNWNISAIPSIWKSSSEIRMD